MVLGRDPDERFVKPSVAGNDPAGHQTERFAARRRHLPPGELDK
jgi:hypothetical protein